LPPRVLASAVGPMRWRGRMRDEACPPAIAQPAAGRTRPPVLHPGDWGDVRISLLRAGRSQPLLLTTSRNFITAAKQNAALWLRFSFAWVFVYVGQIQPLRKVTTMPSLVKPQTSSICGRSGRLPRLSSRPRLAALRQMLNGIWNRPSLGYTQRIVVRLGRSGDVINVDSRRYATKHSNGVEVLP
jgi:hypothetical protein